MATVPLRLFRYSRAVCFRFSSSLAEYTEKPEYPPILDLSKEAQTRRKLEQWGKEIESLKTVEEKLMKVNMPKYYGWSTYVISEDERIPYNSLPFAQYITRTHVITDDKLPNHYSLLSYHLKACATSLDRMNELIKEAIIFECAKSRCEDSEDKNKFEETLNSSIVRHINNIIIGNLSSEFPHLLQYQTTPASRLEAFWRVGGMEPPPQTVKVKKMFGMDEEKVRSPIDRYMQYIAHPILQLRNELLLPPIIERESAHSTDYPVPVFTFTPQVLGFRRIRRHGTNIPGFWPGNRNEFGVISVHKKSPNVIYEDNDDLEALHTQAIFASFSWLMAQACYQGFSMFSDVTYPLVTQTVITDGQYWSFYVYQLNTLLLHSENAVKNPLSNVCWSSGKLKLYDKIENNTVVGFNEEVLKTLLLMYINKPVIRENVDLKPYLGKDVKYIADIEDVERRSWLEQRFKHMYSNRHRFRDIYEIYNWERIYKIKFKTRPLEARRRPFEIGENPLINRTYDDHVPEYIPKSLREDRKKKWKKTYYP